MHRVLEKVPANLVLDPVVRSESHDRKACEREDAESRRQCGNSEDCGSVR